tara:strand:+ start:1379 stop:1552 length:174 start_codon:yes stop_codon:yes gene_type:complete
MDRPNNNKKHDDFVERITNKDLKPKKRPTEKQMFIAPSPKSKTKMSLKRKNMVIDKL